MEGLYFNKGQELIRFIRFYHDGLVLGVSINISNFDSKSENLYWFNREKYTTLWGKGSYTLKNERISSVLNDYVSISFKLSSNQGDVLYSGYIINSEKMHLTFEKESIDKKSDEGGFHWPSDKAYEELVFNRFHSDADLRTDLARYQGYLGLMIKFDSIKLLNEFGEQYVIENGRDKFNKIVGIVKNSDEVKTYINHLKWTSSKPIPEDLQYVMYTHKYFKWSKEETICLGALSTIYMWSQSGTAEEKDEIVSKIMAKMIEHCSNLKFNQFDSFFHRYYRRLKLIVDSI